MSHADIAFGKAPSTSRNSTETTLPDLHAVEILCIR